MYKIMNNLIPPLNHQHFIVNSTLHSYNTRIKDNLHINYCRTKLRQSTINWQGPRLWNLLLPTEVRSVSSINIFKKRVKCFIRAMYG